MNKFITLFLTTLLAVSANAQQYQPVDEKSVVKFGIKNFGLNTGGRFKGVRGVLVFDAANPGASSFDISIDAATVNTDNNSRDGHLRKAEYFDVIDFPRISFKSDMIIQAKGSYQVRGKLTIKGTSKDIVFPFKATIKDDGYLFEGNFRINRRNFKVGGNSLVLSDDVNVILSVFAKKK
jgi:polyisoprenoid-binding protein YceI